MFMIQALTRALMVYVVSSASQILDPTFQYSVAFALPVVEWLEQYIR